jgi:serine/threonine protein kinase
LPICGAASVLHTSTIVHRDIKAGNLLVFVVAKLTDLRAQRASPTANQQGRHHADGVERQVRLRRHADLRGAGAVRSAARPERDHRRARARARLVEPYTEIALPWDIAKAVVAGKRPEWPAERCVPDWFAALVRRMWAPDGAARSVVQDVLLELDAQRCRCRYGDSDSDDRSSVEIVRKLSLRERHHGERERRDENDFGSFLS